MNRTPYMSAIRHHPAVFALLLALIIIRVVIPMIVPRFTGVWMVVSLAVSLVIVGSMARSYTRSHTNVSFLLASRHTMRLDIAKAPTEVEAVAKMDAMLYGAVEDYYRDATALNLAMSAWLITTAVNVLL